MAQTNIKVSELVDKVQRGELTLPEMQRRYVWPATRVRDLLDSLYRGYPSGTILVWETDEDMPVRELAVHATRTPTTSQKLLLLDGQQRVTSLSAIVSGEPVHVRSKNRQKTIDILFNLEHPDGPPVDITEVDDLDFTADIEDVEDEENAERDIQTEMRKRTFVVESRSLKNDPVWVPVSDIFKKDPSEILQATGITSLADPRYQKYSDRLAKIRKIRDYSYTMEILPATMSYEEVTEIFVRVNSLGIKLRGTDLAMAQITSKWKGFMDKVEELSAEFGHDADYILETGLPVRLMTIFATKQSRFKTINKVSREKLEESWKLAGDGLRFAINFVSKNAGVDNLTYLSSPFLIIPIAVYWVLKEGESLTPSEEKKLLRWLFIAHMRGHYSMGSSESILDADLGTLFRNKGLDELVIQLQLHVKKIHVDYDDLANRGIRSPFFSLLYFIFKHDGVKDWWSGLRLSDKHTGNAHTIQYHHIFPKSLLKDYDKKEVNEIANMAFIGGKANRTITNKEPKEYMEKIVAEQTEEALSSQFIPIDRSLWEISNYRNFLAYRRRAIADAMNAFLKKFEEPA
ncbi:MAG: DUF262 domain-containing protein [Patescibacteria group bacterium]